MAPVIDAYPHVSRTYATMTATTTTSTTFVAITLGRSANAVELSVPPAPAVHATGDLKARSYDFLADLLTPHAAHYSSAELFAAFAGHIPTSAYNATLEADGICLVLRSSFFLIDNLTAFIYRISLLHGSSHRRLPPRILHLCSHDCNHHYIHLLPSLLSPSVALQTRSNSLCPLHPPSMPLETSTHAATIFSLTC